MVLIMGLAHCAVSQEPQANQIQIYMKFTVIKCVNTGTWTGK